MTSVMLMETQDSVWVGTSYDLACSTETETIRMTGIGMHLRAPGCGCFAGAGLAGILGFAGGFCCA